MSWKHCIQVLWLVLPLSLADDVFPKAPVEFLVSSLLLGLAIIMLSVLVNYSIKQYQKIKDLQRRLKQRKFAPYAGKSLSNLGIQYSHKSATFIVKHWDCPL
uniref:Uncharacterized protein n=1 Tax=Callorhinchus milii TaxID=7868 RepID=A0A4W3ISK4_CALMI